MKIVNRDIWTMDGYWKCVTTNGFVKSNGRCVMGAGIAKQVRDRIVDFDLRLGSYIRQYGNRLFVFHDIGWISFPVKHHWSQSADIKLIQTSCRQLMDVADKYCMENIALVKPGCGNGGLSWDYVHDIIDPLLDNRVSVVDVR